MDFDTAFNRAITLAGWQVDMSYNQGDTINRDVSKTQGMTFRLMVRRADVESTWNKWDESKQSRGAEKFTTQISSVLSKMRPGMVITLGPDIWTPDP